ncbi:MAG TPA: heavy metal-binding domain-containing protein, partial [Myxococcaceae bacterium]|nr:heavy metal-binding domain-containing protein [Myxococcaceae bacterium]
MTTFDPPPGAAIESVIGPCWGITVRSRSVVGQTCAGCQTFFGGEITALTELASDTRNEAMDRLEQHALQMGANAVLGFRFDSGELMQ